MPGCKQFFCELFSLSIENVNLVACSDGSFFYMLNICGTSQHIEYDDFIMPYINLNATDSPID